MCISKCIINVSEKLFDSIDYENDSNVKQFWKAFGSGAIEGALDGAVIGGVICGVAGLACLLNESFRK